MAYCSDKGITHSEFLGWDVTDRAKQLAFLAEESERCQLCGTAPWEWEENKFAYSPQEHHCQGCYLKSMAADSDHTQAGTTIELVPVTPQLMAQQKLRDKKRLQMVRERQEERIQEKLERAALRQKLNRMKES